MKKFTSTELKQKTGQVLDAVQRENIVVIGNRNRASTIMVSNEFITDLFSFAISSGQVTGLEEVYDEMKSQLKDWEK